MTTVYTDELMAACDCAAGRILQQEDVRAADVEWATTPLVAMRTYLTGLKRLRDGADTRYDSDIEGLEIAIALRVERLGRFAALA